MWSFSQSGRDNGGTGPPSRFSENEQNRRVVMLGEMINQSHGRGERREGVVERWVGEGSRKAEEIDVRQCV